MLFSVAACQNSEAPAPVSTPKTLKDFVDEGRRVLVYYDFPDGVIVTSRIIKFDSDGKLILTLLPDSENEEIINLRYEFINGNEFKVLDSNGNQLIYNDTGGPQVTPVPLEKVNASINPATEFDSRTLVNLSFTQTGYRGEGWGFLIIEGYEIIK